MQTTTSASPTTRLRHLPPVLSATVSLTASSTPARLAEGRLRWHAPHCSQQRKPRERAGTAQPPLARRPPERFSAEATDPRSHPLQRLALVMRCVVRVLRQSASTIRGNFVSRGHSRSRKTLGKHDAVSQNRKGCYAMCSWKSSGTFIVGQTSVRDHPM